MNGKMCHLDPLIQLVDMVTFGIWVINVTIPWYAITSETTLIVLTRVFNTQIKCFNWHLFINNIKEKSFYPWDIPMIVASILDNLNLAIAAIYPLVSYNIFSITGFLPTVFNRLGALPSINNFHQLKC